jgi:uncharacterized protein (TIGR02996 family)
MTLDAFLQTVIADPLHADATWQVLADWLDDQGDARAELVRLLHQPDYRRDLGPEQRDERVRELLASGMQPVVPTIVNSIGMRFALIPAGAFLMGSPASEDRHREDETQHPVEITQPFFMGVFPVTQEEYQRVTGKNPSYFSRSGGGKTKVRKLDTSRFPVETVTHDEAVAFCGLLSECTEEKQFGRSYRLPTEAEWEYACRAGTKTPFHFDETISADQANYNGNDTYGNGKKGVYRQKTTPVGSFPVNAFGLFDMHGNVWEWCQDWFGDYPQTDVVDPQGAEKGNSRVLRGGSWFNLPWHCRSAFRYWNLPGFRSSRYGLRVCFFVE